MCVCVRMFAHRKLFIDNIIYYCVSHSRCLDNAVRDFLDKNQRYEFSEKLDDLGKNNDGVKLLL